MDWNLKTPISRPFLHCFWWNWAHFKSLEPLFLATTPTTLDHDNSDWNWLKLIDSRPRVFINFNDYSTVIISDRYSWEGESLYIYCMIVMMIKSLLINLELRSLQVLISKLVTVWSKLINVNYIKGSYFGMISMDII